MKTLIALLCICAPSLLAQATIVNSVTNPLTVNVLSFGATGNGTTDDSAAINAANSAVNTAGGGEVVFPAGTFITSGITIYDNIKYIGAGVGATTIKLKAGANTNVFTGSVAGYSGGVIAKYVASGGSGSATGTYGWEIDDLTIDGNNANQTGASDGILNYGYGFKIRNVDIQNTYGDCLYNDFNGTQPSTVVTFEPQIVNFRPNHCGVNPANTTVYTVGAVAIRWAGPTDSQWSNIVPYISASENWLVGPNGGAMQIVNLHSWGSHTGVFAPSVVFESGNIRCTNCEAEGSDTVQFALLAGESQIDGQTFQVGSQIGTAIGVQVGQAAGAQAFPGTYYQATPGNGTPGATDSTSASSNYDMLKLHLLNQATGISFNNEFGGKYTAEIYQTTGSYTSGTPSPSGDNWDIKGYGLTCANTLATCGGLSISSGYGTAFRVNNGTNDIFNINGTGNIIQGVNGAYLQLFSDNYSTKTYSVGGSYGLSYNYGATNLTVPHQGEWQANGAIADGVGAVQTPGNNATININVSSQRWGIIPVNPSANITGTILAAGDNGMRFTIVNESAYSITFAASGTSNVADGVNDIIAPLQSATYYWVSGTSLWYRAGVSDVYGNALPATNPQTSTYQVLASDFSNLKTIPVASGTFTITLVASTSQPPAGQWINIVNYGTGAITISPSGQNLNGSSSVMSILGAGPNTPTSLTIMSDGTNYIATKSTANIANVVACGTTTSCSTASVSKGKIFYGSVPLTAGAATVSGLSFTSSTSFICTVTDATAANAATVSNASASSIALAGTSTDTLNFICTGT
jgi:hypothetical protein